MNDGAVTIVAYHYVRDLDGSAFPRIKGITSQVFERQLDYISTRYNVIDSATLVAAAKTNDPDLLPPNAAYLTFDDGLSDHFATVLPALRRRRFHGAFFASAQPVIRRVVAEVHKIQFILAASEDVEALVRQILDLVAQLRSEFLLDSDADYLKRYYKVGRFDPPSNAFVKRMLQSALPTEASRQIVSSLFREMVTQDEAAFADKLYCSTDQLRAMVDCGMYLGGHGNTHRRLAGLSASEQDAEITETAELLATVGAPTSDWIMCYPHGSYDASLINKLRARHCALGLAVETGIAKIGRDAPFALPRLDTNDLPHTVEGTIAGSDAPNLSPGPQ